MRVNSGSRAEEYRDRYLMYRDAGVCVRCKNKDTEKKPDGTRYACCKKCRGEQAEWEQNTLNHPYKGRRARCRRLRERQSQEGTCQDCGSDVLETATRCAKCAEKVRDRTNAKRTRARELVCKLCNGTAKPTHRMSTACPLRFRVSVDEFALARSGPGEIDHGWKWTEKNERKKKHVDRSE